MRTRSGAEYVNIGGYTSLTVAAKGTPNHREIIVGIAPALYARDRQRVLVLGTGTGVTAGAAATVFQRATVVEINPAVYAALPRFARYNFDLANRQNVDFLLADGLGVVATEGLPFDAIISTVTTPLYFSSSKLYTRDFFEMVGARLAPGGVFAFWFDARLAPEGTALILETMAQSFAHCDFVFLHRGYYEAICGHQELKPRAFEHWPPSIQRSLAHLTGDGSLTIDELLDRLLLRPAAPLGEVRWADASHTFDLPALEHVMAREALRPQKDWDLDQWLRFRIADSLLGFAPYRDDRFVERCAVLARVGASRGLPRCTRLMASVDGGRPYHRYLDLAAAAAIAGQEAGMGASDLVQELIAAGRPERALEVMDARDPRRRSAAFERVRLELSLRVRGAVDDAALAALHSRAPLSPNIRRLLITTSLARGQPRAALAHLDILAQLEPLGRQEQLLRQQLHRELTQGEAK